MATDVTMNGNALTMSRGPSFPPEVWSIVGEQIQSRKTLFSLIRTCRQFRGLFTPLLHRRFEFTLSAIPTSELRRKRLPPLLRYAQHFGVFLEMFYSKECKYTKELNDDYAFLVVQMLNEMPNLRTFRWVDASFNYEYLPSLTLRNPEFLQTLKRSPKIKNLLILFNTGYLQDHEFGVNCFFSLNGFKNLTSLELYSFYGDSSELSNDITNTLTECPALKTLGLSVACCLDTEFLPDARGVGKELDFMEKICVEYGSRALVSPLQLDTLRLGKGMFLYDLCEPRSCHGRIGQYLSKLIKTDRLKTFHIYNGLITGELGVENEFLDLGWSHLEGFKSLKQLSVTLIGKDVLNWLNTAGNSVEELIVTEHYGMYDDDLDKFYPLRLPRLSMLFIREMVGYRRSMYSYWEDEDSSKLSTMLRPSCITVLDRLYDNGAQLTRLGLCLDLKSQWTGFASHLPFLRHLKQLRLNGRSYGTGQKSCSWQGAEISQNDGHRFALLIRSKCPSLRYIQIQQFAWEVIYGDPEPKTDEIDVPGVTLRSLDQDEIASIELFAFENFCSENGLLLPERNPRP